jgi:hypothetical protein
MSASDLVGGAQEIGDPVKFVDREALRERRFPVGRKRTPDTLGGRVARLCHFHPYPRYQVQIKR